MQGAPVFNPAFDDAERAAPAAASARASVLDDPQEWPAFGKPLAPGVEPTAPEAAAGCWESQIVLDGMHCATCALTIEDVLPAVPGVVTAEVSGASRRARVCWDAARTRPSYWFEAVASAGYRALPAHDAERRASRQKEQRRMLWRWLVAGFCMMQVMMYAAPAYLAQPGDVTPEAERLLRWASWVITLPMMFFSCGPFFSSAWRDIKHRRIGMDLPVALGMALAFAVSSAGTFDPTGPLGHEVYFDSLTMFVFFLLTGRWLELRLRDRTAGALDALLHRLPDSIERREADGSFVRVAVRRIRLNDVVRVLPGESFPADGTILTGDTLADEALLTGESRPVPRPCGAQVLAGSHNLASPVEVRVDRIGAATRYAGIVALMESAALQRPRLARAADRIAKPFLVAVLAAAALAVVWWWPTDPGRAIMVAVAVLIATCPCALSLATPAATLASAGALARHGVLVRNLDAIEHSAEIDTVVFDKTGTLTADPPTLDAVFSRRGVLPGDALEIAAALAAQSLHPAARAISSGWQGAGRGMPVAQVVDVVERPGAGVEALLFDGSEGASRGRSVRFGSADFCAVAPLQTDGPQVHLADAHGWLASFALRETVRPDAAVAIAALSDRGVGSELLSGDRAAAAERVAREVGIDRLQAGCSPEDKLARVRALQAQGRRVAMVGDGINDGPVLAQANASFAFGQAVPLARAQADFIVLGDQVSTIPQVLALAHRTLRTVRQNIAWAAGYNAVCVPLAFVGWMPAWLAGLGMALSSLLVVLNAARLAKPLAADGGVR